MRNDPRTPRTSPQLGRFRCGNRRPTRPPRLRKERSRYRASAELSQSGWPAGGGHAALLAGRLTDRDRKVALDCYDHRVLTTEQLRRLHFRSRRVAQRRLGELHELRILDWFRPAWQHGEGSTPFHWALDQAGAAVVAELLDLSVDQPRALSQGATGAAHAIPGDATDLGRGLLDSYAGRVRLVLTSPPYGSSLHGQVETGPGQIAKYDNRYSHNPRNLAQLPHHRSVSGRPSFHEALRDVLRACRRMLAPDGYLVLTARPYRQHGELVDLPGQLETLAADAGLTLHERLVALLCRVEPGRLVSRPSFFQLRHQRGGTIPRMLLIAHEDILVFRATETPWG